jgi:hypothetical protein
VGDRRRLGGNGEEDVLLGNARPWGAIGPRECARELGLQRKRPEEGVLRRRRQWRGGGSVVRGGEKDGAK